MADVAATLALWSNTDASNTPAGGTAVGTGLDDNLRAIQGVVVRGLSHKGSDIASASTTDLGAVEGLFHDITGTTAITGFGTVRAGIWKVIKFEGALTLTHNATSLILPGAANITTADGDVGIFVSEGSGNWRCVDYKKSATAPPAISAAQTFLGSDVSLNNTANYFNVCDTGSIGGAGQTWLIIGVCNCVDTAGAAAFRVRIWDGSATTFAESQVNSASANAASLATIMAVVTPSAATTYHLSAKDVTSTSGTALTTQGAAANKATSITAIRLL